MGFEGGLAVLAIGIGFLIDYWPLAQLMKSINHPSRLGWEVMYGAIGTLPLLATALAIERIAWQPFRYLRSTVTKLVASVFREASLLHLAVVSLFAGVGEELMFRGILLDAPRQLVDSPYAPWLALLASSLLFGLAHPFSRTYVALAAAIGTYLGLMMLLTKSLIPPIIAHGLYDFIVLLYLLGKEHRPRTAG